MANEKKKPSVLFSLLAAVCILTASISFWVYKNIYDSTAFQRHVSTAIQTDASRNAISSLIIDEAFKNRPVLKNLLAEQAAPILAGVLQRPGIQEILNRVILRVHDNLVSPQPKAIAIDLTSIKGMINNLTYLLENVTDNERGNVQVPDQIVLVKAGEIPSIAKFGLILLWLGPITLLAGAGLIVWQIVRSILKSQAIKIIGISLASVSLFFIVLAEWYKPIILASFSNSYSRIVGEQILNEFLKSLTSQTWFIFWIGLIMVVGGYLFQRFFPKYDRVSNK